MARTTTITADGRWVEERRSHKYGATRTEIDGIKFPSKREAEAYEHMKLWKREGFIVDFKRQPRFTFPMGFSYVADFEVTWPDGKTTIVDVKGAQTDVFKLKRKCFKYFYPNRSLEIWKWSGGRWEVE